MVNPNIIKFWHTFRFQIYDFYDGSGHEKNESWEMKREKSCYSPFAVVIVAFFVDLLLLESSSSVSSYCHQAEDSIASHRFSLLAKNFKLAASTSIGIECSAKRRYTLA